MIKAVNFGCGGIFNVSTSHVEWINTDKEARDHTLGRIKECDLDKTLPFKDKEIDVGIARSVVPYVSDIKRTISELKRVCKHLRISFPHESSGMPSQILWGKVNYHHFSICSTLVFEPQEIIIEFLWPFGEIRMAPNKRILRIYDSYISRILPCRQFWCVW